MPFGRIFLLECPNPLDLLEGTGETTSLSQVCRLFGHDISTFLIRDSRELRQTLRYIGSLGWRQNRGKRPLFIHLSSHGNDDALAIGVDDVSWAKLAALTIETFQGIYSQPTPYAGPIVLVISACGANGRSLTRRLAAANQKERLEWPPEYVFVFEDDEIDWRDAVVTWTMFYRQAPDIDFLDPSDKGDVQQLLDTVDHSGFGTLRYFRWDVDEGSYKTYAAKARRR